MSKLVDTLLWHLKGLRIPEPELEYRFHATRKWRFDLCWQSARVAVEVDGGTGMNGRHNRPQGYANDCEKINHATALGWRVFRFTSNQVTSGEAAIFLQENVFAVKESA